MVWSYALSVTWNVLSLFFMFVVQIFSLAVFLFRNIALSVFSFYSMFKILVFRSCLWPGF